MGLSADELPLTFSVAASLLCLSLSQIHVIDQPLGIGSQQQQQQQPQQRQFDDADSMQSEDAADSDSFDDSQRLSSFGQASPMLKQSTLVKPLASHRASMKLGASVHKLGFPQRKLKLGSSALLSKHLVSWSLLDRQLGLGHGGISLGRASPVRSARKFGVGSASSYLGLKQQQPIVGRQRLTIPKLRSAVAPHTKLGWSGKRQLKQSKMMKMKLKQSKLKQSKWLKLKQMKQMKQSKLGDSSADSASCIFSDSCVCSIVDSLSLNPAWQRERSNPQKLFSASNAAETTQCSADQSKSYSRDAFSQQTISKCYDPDVYTCAQGKLILAQSLQNQQIEQQTQQQTQQTQQSQLQSDDDQYEQQSSDQYDDDADSDYDQSSFADQQQQSSLGVGMGAISDRQRRADAGWVARGD